MAQELQQLREAYRWLKDKHDALLEQITAVKTALA